MNRLFLLLFWAVTFVAHAQVPDYVPTEGLVGWYPLDGNALDLSALSNNGSVHGATPTQDRYGNENGALSFDVNDWSWGSGGNWVYIPFHEEFNTPEVTVSTWVKRNSGGYEAVPQGLSVACRFQYGYSNPNGESWVLSIGNDDSSIGSKFVGYIIQQSPSPAINISSTSPEETPLQEWIMLTMTWDGDTLKLFQDGLLVSETIEPGFEMNSIGSSGISLGMSVQANGHWGPLDGDLDDFAVWNRALTEAEILLLHTTETPDVPGCTDPTACNYDAEATEDDGSCEFCSCLSQPTVAAGYGTNYAINTLGQVYGWGGNNLGQTDIPDNLVGVQQIEGGEEFCILLHADSSVQVIGSNGPYGASVPAGMKGIDIAAGRHHMVVVEANGALTHIGPNYAGLTNEPVVSNAVDGAAGWYHNAGVLDNGEVVGWGNAWVEPETPITNAVEIEAGNGHNIVLTSEHTIIEWGGDIGSMSVWDTLTNVVDIAAGWNRSLALMSDGTILAWSPQSGNIIIDRDEYSGVIDADIEHNAIIILLENGEIVTALDVPEEVEIITPGWSNCDLCLADADGDGICNDEEGPCNENPDPCLCDDIVVYGCVDPEACNYTSEANCGDESCVYPPLGLSNCYDGETFCGDGTTWNPATQVCESIPCGTENTCPSDLNGNGMVEVSDLLMVLADFGSECVPPVAEWACGDPVNYHGYDYATVQIGEQCWFAENLRTTNFRSGEEITQLQDDSAWVNSDIPGWCFYEDSVGTSLPNLGLLYNFFVVGNNICPSEWHIPNFAEWFQEGGLRHWISNNYPEIGIQAGGSLKTSGTSEWQTPNAGATNQFGFNGRPSGGRNLEGEFLSIGTEANYHIHNTFGGGEAHHVYLKSHTTVFDRDSPWQGDAPATWHWGTSIRCVHD